MKVSKNPRIWLLIVLTVAIITRAELWLTYPLAQGNDTATYLHLANSLKNNAGFDRYNGTRTPGYPFFIMVAGNNQNVYLFQLGLGLLSTLLIFFISWRLSHKAWFAGMMALTHTLNLGQLFFEAAYLSEALATFFLFLILACLVILFNRQNTRPETQAERISVPVILLISLIIGLTSAALAMTRPLFAFVPFLGVVFMLVFWRNIPFRTRLFASILTALPAFLILLLWINFIYTRFNVLGMDSIGGYHLVNHTSSFFELAPAEFAPVRDTFLKFRAEQIKTSGSPVNTIWDAIPSLMFLTWLIEKERIC